MVRELRDGTKLVAVEEHLTSDVQGEKVVLHTEEETYYGIEGVGARAWDLLQKPTTFRELQDEIVSQYDVEPDRCRRDLEVFVGDLLEKGLIERVTDGTEAERMADGTEAEQTSEDTEAE